MDHSIWPWSQSYGVAFNIHILLVNLILLHWKCSRITFPVWGLSDKISFPRRLGKKSSLRPITGESVFPEDLIGSKSTVIGARMSQRKWTVTKQQLIWWPDLALLGCSLVSLHFQCDILAPIMVQYQTSGKESRTTLTTKLRLERSLGIFT